MAAIDDLIVRANNVLSVLENLIQGDAAQTFVPDLDVSYAIPTPTYNETTHEWTLSQDTADTDTLYKAVFTLGAASACAEVQVVSHNVITPDDGVPARYQDCNTGKWVDLSNKPRSVLDKIAAWKSAASAHLV